LESRIQQNVDRLVNDKFKCTSIAIDALRDQLVILADEVRQLNRNATSQERRVDVLCHDADSRRGTINIMEAHMQEENSRIKSLGMEMERLKQEMATKASLVDVKTGLKSTRLKSNNSLSDLKAQLEKQMQQISTGTQAFQRNLVDAMKQTVHEEVALVEGKSLAMLEKEAQKISLQNKDERDKECVKVISQIVTKVIRLLLFQNIVTISTCFCLTVPTYFTSYSGRNKDRIKSKKRA
jgi:chromosome segregation ATPase